MKLKSSIMGLALAGAVALCSSAPAQAQQRPIEPYYFAPKLLYSYTNMDSFGSRGRVNGAEFNQYWYKGTGRYKGADTHDKTFGGGASVGYDFGAYSEYPIRLELEYLHRGNINASYPTQVTAYDGLTDSFHTSNYSVKSTIQTVMANAYLDFPTETAFTPYVGAGLGGAYTNSTISGYSRFALYGETGYYEPDKVYNPQEPNHLYGPYLEKMGGQQSGWNFAWQVSAGFSYQINDSMALDLSYRYSDFGSADFGSNKKLLTGKVVEVEYSEDPTTTPPTVTPGENGPKQNLGTYDTKGKYDLSAHEVILGLRIMAF